MARIHNNYLYNDVNRIKMGPSVDTLEPKSLIDMDESSSSTKDSMDDCPIGLFNVTS